MLFQPWRQWREFLLDPPSLPALPGALVGGTLPSLQSLQYLQCEQLGQWQQYPLCWLRRLCLLHRQSLRLDHQHCLLVAV